MTARLAVVVGLIGGSLSIDYNSTESGILFSRFRREEEVKHVYRQARSLAPLPGQKHFR